MRVYVKSWITLVHEVRCIMYDTVQLYEGAYLLYGYKL